MTNATAQPPGWPGIDPTWSSSAKDIVTTALGVSRVWATFGFGIVNEVYWPSTGHPQIRDLGFIVAGPDGWTEVKRAQRYTITTPRPSVPLPTVVHEADNYRLELEFLPHPLRDVLLIRYRLDGDGLRLYALLAPHLNGERNNDGWANADLEARLADTAVCLRADCGFRRTSVGYVGASDGWQDFAGHGAMTWSWPEALAGNIALTGEAASNAGILALAFAQTREGARTLAHSAIADDYDETRRLFIDQWRQWASTLVIPDTSAELRREAELSAAMIKVHEDRTYAGAVVASLSIPWGNSRDDPGGYHLVWTRDTVETAFAMIAAGQIDDAARTLAYIIGTQAPDGSWAQNHFPDGRGYWAGRQLDEVALPVLLMAKLGAVGRLPASLQAETMVRGAVGFIVRNGPMSDQDRWEENAGASPFTLAVTVCALVAAAPWFDGAERRYILALADCWNERIEEWTFAENGVLASRFGVDGYYVRLTPRPGDGGPQGVVPIRNTGSGSLPADALVGMEFLYLVRTGLRAPDDPRIVSTLKVVEAMLRADTPSGPTYHRYNGDGYGEHQDGSAFDGTGIGRLWPLLTGERGHYAVSAGESANPWLYAMARMTGPGGMLPEQVWDAAPVPERLLVAGKPSGSAMPLVWAHAEFLKLLVAGADGRPAELLEAVEARYARKRPEAAQWYWRADSPFAELPSGRALQIEACEPFVLHFGIDGWQGCSDRPSQPTAFGMHGVRFAPGELEPAHQLDFTFHYPDRGAWEGADHVIALAPAD